MRRWALTTLALAGLVWAGEPAELVKNGDFETEDLGALVIRGREGDKKTALSEGFRAFRDTLRAKDGKGALRCQAGPGQSLNLNLLSLKFEPGKRYRLSFDYFIEKAGKGMSFSGRIATRNKAGAYSYHFPKWDKDVGQWKRASMAFTVNADSVNTTVTIWVGGPVEMVLDNLSCKEEVEQQLSNSDAAVVLLGRKDGCAVWKEAPYLKVPYSSEASLKNLDGRKIGAVEFFAAANEREPFQLVLSPDRDIQGVSLSFSELKSAGGDVLPASGFGYNPVGYIDIKHPNNPKMAGWNADPLLPDSSADAKAGRNTPFFVWYDVPAKAVPGCYEGVITMRGDQFELACPVRLTVRSFALPEETTFKSSISCTVEKAYCLYDKRPYAVIKDDICRLIGGLKLQSLIAYGRLPFKVEEGKVVITDWTGFDKFVKGLDRYGFKAFRACGLSMLGDSHGWFEVGNNSPHRDLPRPFLFADKYDWLSPEDGDIICQYTKLVQEHVKQNFPDKSWMAYIYDEPPERVYAKLKQITNMLHEAVPDLKIFITKTCDADIGYVHTWNVPFAPGFVRQDLQQAEFAKGNDIWYYNWPIRLNDFDYIRNRLFTWQIYENYGTGGLLWRTANCANNANPWTDMDKTYECGAATIFYPPRKAGESMISSQRAAMLRESVDDFDYFKLLEARIDQWHPGKGRQRVMEIIRALIPDGVFSYVNDPHLLYALRGRIADEIERYSEYAPLVLSNPPENTGTEYSTVSLDILAPAGSKVVVDGKEASLPSCTAVLPLFGLNVLDIQITAPNGNVTRLTRSFTRRKDEKVLLLEQSRAAREIPDELEAQVADFLKSLENGPYGAPQEKKAGELALEVRKIRAQRALENVPQVESALSQALRREARTMFDAALYERCSYYLERARQADGYKAGKVTVTPTVIEDHFGFVLDNGIVCATVLETGGRILSFKYKGTEMLSRGHFRNALPRLDRARKAATSKDAIKLHGLGGYEEAGQVRMWPDSWNDWDFSFPVLNPDKVVVRGRTKVGNSPFVFMRDVTLEAGAHALKVDCEFTNTMSPELQSDDPEHFQCPWRGRFLPAIGEDGVRNDVLDVPTTPPLPECDMEAREIQYSNMTIPLDQPWAGAHDAKTGMGFRVKLDDNLQFAYVWFDSRKKAPVYTLEFVKTFREKNPNAPRTNAPFEIKPGTSKRFAFQIEGYQQEASTK